MSARRIRELVVTLGRGFVRDRAALFFTIVFPLMFLVVIAGLLGGDAGSRRVDVFTAGGGTLVDRLPTEVFDVERVASVEEGLRRVRRGDRPALVYQQGDRLQVRFAASDQVGGATAQSVLQAVVARANVAAAGGGAPPRYSVEARPVEDTALTPVEFLTPGLLGWSIAVSGVFGSALTLVDWRQKGLLRRLRLSPLSTGEIAVARIVVSLGVALLQSVVFFAVSMTVLGLHPSGSWWMSVPLVLLGTLAFLPVGLIAGAVAKSTEAASAIANLVTLPMAFLSGSFFPLEIAPGWVQNVAAALPLKYLVEGLTDVMVRGLGPSAAVGDMAVLALFGAVFCLVALRVVRIDVE